VVRTRTEAGFVLIVGSEPTGLASETRAILDASVRIPMAAGVESLNVAAAGAIAMHGLSASMR
jgi:tRNA G18 (ribose-2'-O)-methylase SpoU